MAVVDQPVAEEYAIATHLFAVALDEMTEAMRLFLEAWRRAT